MDTSEHYPSSNLFCFSKIKNISSQTPKTKNCPNIEENNEILDLRIKKFNKNETFDLINPSKEFVIKDSNNFENNYSELSKLNEFQIACNNIGRFLDELFINTNKHNHCYSPVNKEIWSLKCNIDHLYKIYAQLIMINNKLTVEINKNESLTFKEINYETYFSKSLIEDEMNFLDIKFQKILVEEYNFIIELLKIIKNVNYYTENSNELNLNEHLISISMINFLNKFHSKNIAISEINEIIPQLASDETNIIYKSTDKITIHKTNIKTIMSIYNKYIFNQIEQIYKNIISLLRKDSYKRKKLALKTKFKFISYDSKQKTNLPKLKNNKKANDLTFTCTKLEKTRSLKCSNFFLYKTFNSTENNWFCVQNLTNNITSRKPIEKFNSTLKDCDSIKQSIKSYRKNKFTSGNYINNLNIHNSIIYKPLLLSCNEILIFSENKNERNSNIPSKSNFTHKPLENSFKKIAKVTKNPTSFNQDFNYITFNKQNSNQKTKNKKISTHETLLNSIIHKKSLVCDCEVCRLQFKQLKHLKMIQMQKLHICYPEECQRQFEALKNLKVYHMKKLHICHYEYCHRQFKELKHLKVHQMQHTDLRPLNCSKCAYSCRQRNSMNWHMRAKHGFERILTSKGRTQYYGKE